MFVRRFNHDQWTQVGSRESSGAHTRGKLFEVKIVHYEEDCGGRARAKRSANSFLPSPIPAHFEQAAESPFAKNQAQRVVRPQKVISSTKAPGCFRPSPCLSIFVGTGRASEAISETFLRCALLIS